MSASTSTAQQSVQPQRRRGGRSRAPQANLIALRPAQVSPRSQSGDNDEASNGNEVNASTRRTAAGPTRSGARNTRGRHARHVVEARQFGGKLTNQPNEDAQPAEPTTRLQANAVAFEPGQSIHGQPQSPRPNQPRAQARRRRHSKSTAPDIATRVHEDIENRQYECPICTNEVLRNSKVWSCHKCWTVFHLGCVKQWSTNSEATANEQAERSGQRIGPHQWRCPGCNIPQDVKPRSYTCWCEKEHEPRPTTGIPPHSCGQTCGKTRLLPKKCPHPCELLCHAGPCPPCTHVGPKQSCFCGKESTSRRCIDTDYESGWSCESICGDSMPCGEHTCERQCHEGLCGACEVRIDARCYCGKEERPILCCDKDDDKSCKRIYSMATDDMHVVEDAWTGSYRCVNTCDRPYSCGKHFCDLPCHSTTETNAQCPRSPEVVIRCPCGKTCLDDILEKARASCEDPIPHCSRICSKELPCGHLCQQTCHLGECMPCLESVSIRCRCGKTEHSTICHQGVEEAPQCMRVCHATLNCGRHECSERCCPGERKSVERLAAKKRGRPLNSTRSLAEDFEAEHICTRLCARILKCGTHTCQDLCHKGPCSSCPEAIFDEVPCHCGRTVLQPPLPCGTKAPPCRWDCERPKRCGHRQVPHNCHSNDETCPRCPYLTEKKCLCGKKSVKNQQCWFTDTRCGQICESRLKCGLHTCRQTCHRPGECEDRAGKCSQSCGKPKRVCDHPCEDECHAPYPCKQDKPCTHKTLITCPCQHNKQEMRCNASATNPSSETSKSLKCDDECARLERNRLLASALDIDPATHTDDFVPYSAETMSLFSTLPTKWCEEQEREFRVFADSEAEKRIRFKPMLSQQRAFVHALADDFGLDSESMDPEPHRHVAIFKTPRFVSAPAKTLRDCMRIRKNQQASAAAEASAQYQQHQAQLQAARNKSVTPQPFNGYVLSQPSFGLTEGDLLSAVLAALGPASSLKLQVFFLPTGDVALLASQAQSSTAQAHIESLVRESKTPLARIVNLQKLGQLQLAHIGADNSITYRESDSMRGQDDDVNSGGGWSQVAAKSAAPRLAPTAQSFGTKSSFTVLGTGKGAMPAELMSAKTRVKKEKAKGARVTEDIVDDWETEVDKESAEETSKNGVSDVHADEEAPRSEVDGDVQDGAIAG